MSALECWSPQSDALLRALDEFVPVARNLPIGATDLEGSTPIATPRMADIQAVACVHAPTHQDLPYPRWSVLAPVLVREDAVLTVVSDGVEHTRKLRKGELIILDSHSPHSLSAPEGWPSQEELDKLPEHEREALKRKNLSVFLNYDTPVRPTRQQAEAEFARILHLSAPAPRRPGRRR